MNKIIGVTELQRHFKRVIDEVTKRGVPYILTRGSRPEAAIVPYDEFLRFQELQEREVLYRLDRLTARMAGQNAQYSEEEIDADIRTAREAGRRR